MKKFVSRGIKGGEMDYPLVIGSGYICYDHAVAVPTHAHAGYEFLFLIDGELAYEMDNGEVYTIRGGEYFFMCPGTVHKPLTGYESPSLVQYLIIDLSIQDCGEHVPFSRGELTSLRRHLQEQTPCVHSCDADLQNSLQRYRDALDAFHSNDPQLFCKGLLRATVSTLIVDAITQLEYSVQSVSSSGEAAVRFIQNNLANPISLTDIARHLGCGEHRTYMIMKEYVGQSPIDYLLRLRVHTAKRMLQESDASVSAIASKCGFNSSQYFSRVFKRFMGSTPTAYRQGNVVSE